MHSSMKRRQFSKLWTRRFLIAQSGTTTAIVAEEDGDSLVLEQESNEPTDVLVAIDEPLLKLVTEAATTLFLLSRSSSDALPPLLVLV